jgi:hypothetical protein
MKKLLFSISLIFLLVVQIVAQPQLVTVEQLTDSPELNALFEIQIEVETADELNFFDYDQIVLKAVFRSPSLAEMTVEGFYFQDFETLAGQELMPIGDPHYRIRFSPGEIGSWEFMLILQDQTGQSETEWQSFWVAESDYRGFLKVAPNRRQLVDQEGKLVFLSGENIAWTSNYPGYDPMVHYFELLAHHGGNFAKLMLTPWGYHLEWEGGLRNYMPQQQDAYMLDSLFRMAHHKDIFLQLAISIHNELNFGFSDEDWTSNPYNIDNGGFCKQPQEFFTNMDARAAYKNRMRYLIARYGYSRNLAAWEIFSETDNFPFYSNFKNQISNWVIDMANWLQQNDPWNHLVSVGYALPESEPRVWQHPSVDFTQLHLYYKHADLAGDVVRQMNMYLRNYQKPVLVGEFGIGHFSDSMAVWDPQGLALHNALFASSISGSMGGVVPWYWEEYVDQLNLYGRFGAVHNFAFSEQNPAENPVFLHLITDADDRDDWKIIPNYFSLTAPSPSKFFKWHTTGQLVPSADSLNRYLYGPLSLFSALRNPPVFQANFLHETILQIETGSQVNQAVLQVKQDFAVIFEQSVEPNESYWIEFPPGNYQLSFDNIGVGFASVIEIEKIVLEDFLPHIRAFGLQTDDQMKVWIQNRDYNWKTFYDTGLPPDPASAEVFLPLMPGTYRLDWFNTDTGVIDSVRIKEANKDGMILHIDELTHDMALQLNFITAIKSRDRFPGVVVYPNPARKKFTFAFELIKAAKVVLQVIDSHGRTVYMAEKSDTFVGTNQIHWLFDNQHIAAHDLKSGVYIYRLMLPDRTVTGKLMLTE